MVQLKTNADKSENQQFITKNVPELKTPEYASVCLPPGFHKSILAITRDGVTKTHPISKRLAAELISMGLSYEG